MFERKTALRYTIEKFDPEVTVRDDDYYELRSWQSDAYDAFDGERFVILNAPTGSGKSMLVSAVSATRMAANDRLRTIIAVPQTIIGSSFTGLRFVLPNGDEAAWDPAHELFRKSRRGNVEQLVEVLERAPAFCDDGTVVCTHATLVALHKHLQSEDRLGLLDDVLVWIDEAHHLKNVETAEDDLVLSNAIGDLVTYLLDVADERNVQLGLVTATLFRGDRLSVLTSEQQAHFTRYNLPYDEYLARLQNLKSFSYDFVLCDRNYLDGVRAVVEDEVRKDIVYVPHPVSRYSSGDKYAEADAIKSAYRDNHGDLKILDLVDEEDRTDKKSFLAAKLDDRNALDVIVTLGMFKEGANWDWAERAIIGGPRNSLVDVVQMMGRLFRDAEGKEHVEVVHLLPFDLGERGDDENYRSDLNNYLKAVFASLILENAIVPVKLKGLPRRDYIGDALTDESDQQSFMEDAYSTLLDVQVLEVDMLGENLPLRDRFSEEMESVLDKHGVTTDRDAVKDHTWGTMIRPVLRLQGLDVSEIDLDLVGDVNPLDHLLHFTSGRCGLDTFAKLRDALYSGRDPERKKAEILALAKSGADRPRLLTA